MYVAGMGQALNSVLGTFSEVGFQALEALVLVFKSMQSYWIRRQAKVLQFCENILTAIHAITTTKLYVLFCPVNMAKFAETPSKVI